MKSVIRFASASALALAVAAAAPAQQAAPQQPQMSPEEQRMMEAMEAAGRLGEEHKWMASMAGTWELTATFWMGPGSEPMVSKGTAERALALGGRVMTEHVTAEMMGAPFEGHGMMGFDNVSKKWWGTWNDNMMTGLMTSTGTCAEAKCDHQMTGWDPVSGQLKTTRATSKHETDREEHAMYDVGPDGQEFKSMELVYVRKK